MQKASSRTGESSFGCGVLSHDEAHSRCGAKKLRHSSAARLGALVIVSALGFAAGCSDATNPDAAGGTGGSGGSGGSGTSGGGGSGGGGSAETSTACAIKTNVDSYVANMSKQGKSKSMLFQLVQSNPGPPIKGKNEWKVKITDAAGMPVSSGLTVRVWMPEHGHDSPTAAKITYDAATSTFALIPVDMSTMGGTWRVTLTVNDLTDPSVPVPLDAADFDFCVD
jgi:hypothetical protein